MSQPDIKEYQDKDHPFVSSDHKDSVVIMK